LCTCRQNKPHRLEADLGFPPGTEATIHQLNQWDRQLTDVGRVMLALDAAYYATAAAAMLATTKAANNMVGRVPEEQGRHESQSMHLCFTTNVSLPTLLPTTL
jgi:hypothetical protein